MLGVFGVLKGCLEIFKVFQNHVQIAQCNLGSETQCGVSAHPCFRVFFI